MRHYKITYKTEIRGIRTVSARVLADNPEHARKLYKDKNFERYLVVEEQTVESPIDETFVITEDTGAFDVV